MNYLAQAVEISTIQVTVLSGESPVEGAIVTGVGPAGVTAAGTTGADGKVDLKFLTKSGVPVMLVVEKDNKSAMGNGVTGSAATLTLEESKQGSGQGTGSTWIWIAAAGVGAAALFYFLKKKR